MRCASQSKLDRIAAKRGSRSRRRLFHLAELDATPEFSSGLMAQMRREPSSSADRTRSSLGTDGATSSGERPKRSSRAHRWVPATGGCRDEAGNICALRRRYGVQFRRNEARARSDRALSHPNPEAIEMRWNIPPFAARRGAPPNAAPNNTKLATMARPDPAE